MTTKKERVIKNLYDIQKIDSWEDSGAFMAAVEGVLHFNGYKFMYLGDVIDERLEQLRDEVSKVILSSVVENDEDLKIMNGYCDSEEAFCDLTNCGLSFDKFREICITYIDFTEKTI